MFGCSLTNSQCQKRWTQYLMPELAERKIGPWTADEVGNIYLFLSVVMEIRTISSLEMPVSLLF
jgi:hypothetical protein